MVQTKNIEWLGNWDWLQLDLNQRSPDWHDSTLTTELSSPIFPICHRFFQYLYLGVSARSLTASCRVTRDYTKNMIQPGKLQPEDHHKGCNFKYSRHWLLCVNIFLWNEVIFKKTVLLNPPPHTHTHKKKICNSSLRLLPKLLNQCVCWTFCFFPQFFSELSWLQLQI